MVYNQPKSLNILLSMFKIVNLNNKLWLKAKIIKKLKRHGYIGGRHTSFENIPKGFKKHLWKDVKEAAEELIAEGILVEKMTSYGRHVYLNPKRIADIDRIIKEGLGEESEG